METTYIVLPQQEFKDFMAMPDGLVKNIKFYNDIYSRAFSEASITKKDGCIYYAANTFKVVKSTKSSYYVRRTTKDGFTINEKGKVSVWFNKSIFQVPHIMQLFKHLNFNWFSEKLYPFVTKTIFEKMVAGKITNNTDIAKAYIKAMRINCSPALFLQLFENTSISKQEFLRQASVAKDVNHLIEYLLSPNDTRSRLVIEDMIKEAQMLERKIDYKWSSKRLTEEHKAWTEQIMQVEIDSLDNESIPGVERFDRYTPDEFKLLKTQKDVFYEGKTMKHCVYTAYWTSIKNNTYIAYHVTNGDEEATLGVNVYSDKVVYNQCYSRYNGSISSKLQTKVKSFVEELNEQVQRDGILKETVEQYVQKTNHIINEYLPF
jgi:hypothetical protein